VYVWRTTVAARGHNRDRRDAVNRFRLVFAARWIPEIASRYDYPLEGAVIADGRRARELGYYPYDVFVRLYRWKTRGRPLRHLARTDSQQLEAATRIALDSQTAERRRAGVLVGLDGIEYPVASCVLHFAHADPYPILDRRALESLGYKTQRTIYSETFWQDYVAACRDLAYQNGVSMRDLDRALWTWPGLPDRDRYRQDK
jgi:hypothetical protein